MIKIYTRGICRPNPGRGAWSAAIIVDDNHKQGVRSRVKSSTSQQVGLVAALRSLRFLRAYLTQHDLPIMPITVYTDSRYVADAFNHRWVVKWQENGYRKLQRNQPISHAELWKQLIAVVDSFPVPVRFVTRTSPGPYDERINELTEELMKGG